MSIFVPGCACELLKTVARWNSCEQDMPGRVQWIVLGAPPPPLSGMVNRHQPGNAGMPKCRLLCCYFSQTRERICLYFDHSDVKSHMYIGHWRVTSEIGSKFCAGENSADSCNGDSGGPLVARWATSLISNEVCGTNFPVFVWIHDVNKKLQLTS